MRLLHHLVGRTIAVGTQGDLALHSGRSSGRDIWRCGSRLLACDGGEYISDLNRTGDVRIRNNDTDSSATCEMDAMHIPA